MTNPVSFFDSESPHQLFEFLPPTPEQSKELNNPPLCSGTIICTIPETQQSFSAMFGLYGSLLVRFKSSVKEKPIGLLDVVFAKLRCISTDRVILMRNGKSLEFEFTSEDSREKWVEALQLYCIMTNFHEKYLKLKMIGRGSFAQVFLVQSKLSERFYAAKTFVKENFHSNDSTPSTSKLSLINEINLIRTLKHYNLIRLHEVFETENSLYIVMDLVQGKSLEDILSRPKFKEEFSDEQVMYLFHSILECTAYMASKGIMHRDLKPTNILVEKEGRVKLIDLGLATYIDLPKYIFNRCGSPGYIAPEVFTFKEDVASSRYNDRCDVFSAGCILYYMMFGKPLFEGASCSKIVASNKDATNLQTNLALIQKEIKDKKGKMNKEGLSLLAQLLEPDHKKRIKAKQALEHAYFKPLRTKDIRLSSSKDMIFETLSNYKWGEPKSPNLVPQRGSFMGRGSFLGGRGSFMSSSEYGSPNPMQPQEKYVMMDSMHLNVGRPEMNGKIDTLGSMIGLQSPLLKNAQRLIDNSRSSFSIASNKQGPQTPQSSKNKNYVSLQAAPRRNIKPMTAQPDQTFLKAAIFKNMKKNEDIVEITDSNAELLGVKQERSERRFTDYVITRTAEEEAENRKEVKEEKEEEEEEEVDFGFGVDDEDCKVQMYVEKIKYLEILKPDAKMARF